MTIKTAAEPAQKLRQRAEAKYQIDKTMSSQPLSPTETERLLHELEVHQIQLEMQNEELRQSQCELESARANYFDLYDLAPAGYLTISEKGLIQQANLAAATMLGVVRNFLPNKRISRFVFPEDQDVYFQHRTQLIDSGELQNWEMRLKRSDGSHFWAALQSTLAHNGENWITLHDITERKLAEEALREMAGKLETQAEELCRLNESLEQRVYEQTVVLQEERQRLAGIIRGTNAGTWEWNVQTGEAVFNVRWAEMIGCTLKEISPVSIETCWNFTHPDDLKISNELLEKHFRGELDYYECESRMRHKDGNWVWVLDRGKVVTWNEDGKPLMMMGTHQDITEHRQVESVKAARLHLMQFADSHSLNELLRETLDKAEALTGSQAGFYHFVEPDQVTLSLQAWSTSTAKMCKAVGSGSHYPVDQAGVWVDCIRERKAVIHNDYASLPHRKGLPDGHAQIVRELVVPVLRGDAIVAILGVGNKPIAYNERDIETITSLADLAWDIVQNKRSDHALRKRMKELGCLYGIMNLFNFPGVSFGEIMSEVVLLIPSGWQFPEITEARIVIDGDTYQTPRFRETPWMMTREIFSNDKLIGDLKVCYLEERQTEDQGPFFIEEKNLLNAIAEKLDLAYERKLAETEMRKLARAVEQSPVTIVITDTQGTIEFVNPKFTELTGYEAEEVVGMGANILRTDQTPPETIEKMWSAIAAGKTWEGEFVNKRKDGKIFYEHATISPLYDDNGAITHYLAVKEDITEKKSTMEQLIHSQKMESIGELAGGLAHDLNNILSVINGYATLAKLDMKKDQKKDQKELHFIDTILSASSRAASLTHSLLAYSRKQEMNLQYQNLKPLIETVGSFIKRIIHDNIEFTFSATDDPLTVYVDSVQMEQVLLNLATNARDAMPNGGTFSIATATGSIDDQYISTHGYGTAGDYAVITVSDTGHGMDAQTRLKVFDPFFTTKEVGRGTGLGLAMVMGIIKQHGGFIDLQSEPGKGSVFQIYLPLVDAEGFVSNVVNADDQIEKGSGTIMVIEDEPEIRSMMEDLLTRIGYTVLSALDGQDAVEKFAARKEEIPLVISDVVMPRKSGKAACDEIRQMSDKTKFIFISGHTTHVIQRVGELDADTEVIMKPIMPFELLKRIRDVMN